VLLYDEGAQFVYFLVEIGNRYLRYIEGILQCVVLLDVVAGFSGLVKPADVEWVRLGRVLVVGKEGVGGIVRCHYNE